MAKREVVRGTVDTPKIMVFISGDDDATIAEAHYTDKFMNVTAVRSAKRMDQDQYSERIAVHLAAGRALRDLARIMLKDGNTEVKVMSDQAKRAAQLQAARNKARKKNAEKIKAEMKNKAKQKQDAKAGKAGKSTTKQASKKVQAAS